MLPINDHGNPGPLPFAQFDNSLLKISLAWGPPGLPLSAVGDNIRRQQTFLNQRKFIDQHIKYWARHKGFRSKEVL